MGQYRFGVGTTTANLPPTTSETRLMPIEKETEYLHSYIRGVYTKRDLKEGEMLTEQDVYLAIPLQKGQLSCRELMLGKWGHKTLKGIERDQPIMIDAIDTPYAENDELKKIIYDRGI